MLHKLLPQRFTTVALAPRRPCILTRWHSPHSRKVCVCLTSHRGISVRRTFFGSGASLALAIRASPGHNLDGLPYPTFEDGARDTLKILALCPALRGEQDRFGGRHPVGGHESGTI